MRQVTQARLAGMLSLILLLASLGVSTALAGTAPPLTPDPAAATTIGAGSCVGTEACLGATGNIGDNSCIGDYACRLTTGDIGSNSCNGDYACNQATADIGDDSCNAGDACSNSSGSIGDDSCNFNAGCTGSAANIGNGSCNAGQLACSNTTGTIGNGSCNGANACYSADAVIGDNSCNGAGVCSSRQTAVGDCEDNLVGFEPAICLVDYQPDGRIKRVGGPLKGNDIYNDTALNQSVNLRMYAGQVRVAFITVQNDGNTAGSFWVDASGGSATGFDIRYYIGRSSNEITGAVENGAFVTPVLAPGSTYRIRVRSQVSTATPRGSQIMRMVLITSNEDPAAADTVGFTVKRK